ncbi:little elongation complex subunit 1 isoform X2 [Microcaecilia unicolor]|uniref:Little elongation complex subunit 1 isoform X2 n=1 Tax=Microcaecilia unicolor TaxID=1415580 RepID=A0A6P7YDE5_9AMPH|nr:little elongation complex subunit 1 isoform X2 [Microcaecilia unicolor]
MMPGETQSRPGGTAGSCQNCSVLQQSLNEYMAALIALKQKIIDTDHLLTEYQQKCDELQITERENSTLRHQLEQMLQSILPQEKCKEELELMKAELEEKKSSLKQYQQTHLEYIRVKEECDRSDAVKRKLEAKLKKLEDTSEKQNQDVKQLKMEKNVLERRLKKTQEKLEGFQKKSYRKALKHAQTQAVSEEPVVHVDKKKIKQLLEELWECIDSATEEKQNTDDNHFLEKKIKKCGRPRKSDGCIVAPSHNSPFEPVALQRSITVLGIKSDSEPQEGDMIKLSNKFKGDVEDCSGDSAFYEAKTLNIPVERDLANNSSDSDQEDENYFDKLLEVLKYVKPLPPLLSPVPFSLSVTQGAMFGKLIDSTDEESDQSGLSMEDLSESKISEPQNNFAFLCVSKRSDSIEQLSEPVHGRNRSSKLEGNEERLTSDSLADTMTYFKERVIETDASNEHSSVSAEHLIMCTELMEVAVADTVCKTHRPEVSQFTETLQSDESILATEEMIADSDHLVQTHDEPVQSEHTDFTNKDSENLDVLKEKPDESEQSTETIFANDSTSVNLKHLQETSNELRETKGKVSSKLEESKSNHAEAREKERIQTEETVMLPEFVLRNHEPLDISSCESVASENVQIKLNEYKSSLKEEGKYEPVLTVKNMFTPLSTRNQGRQSITSSESEENKEKGTRLTFNFDSTQVSGGESITLCQHQCEGMQTGESDNKIKSVPTELDNFEEKVTETLQTEHDYSSNQLEINNAGKDVSIDILDVSVIKCESIVSFTEKETDSRPNEEATHSAYTCGTVEQPHEKNEQQKTAEMIESSNLPESRVNEFLTSQEQGRLLFKSKHDPDKERKPLQTQGKAIAVHILPPKDMKGKNELVEYEATANLHYVSENQVLTAESNSALSTCVMTRHISLFPSATKNGIESLESDVADEHLPLYSKSLPEKNKEQLKTNKVIAERIPAVESKQAVISHAQSVVNDSEVCVETEYFSSNRMNAELNKVQSNSMLPQNSDLDKNLDIVVIGLGQEKSTMEQPEQTHEFSDKNKLFFSEIRANKEQLIPVYSIEGNSMCKEEMQSGTEDAVTATDGDSLHSIQLVSTETVKSNCRGVASITTHLGWVDCYCSREDGKQTACSHLFGQLEDDTEKGHGLGISKFKQFNTSLGCEGNSELETENGSRQQAVKQEPHKPLGKHGTSHTGGVCCDAKDHAIQMCTDPLIVKVNEDFVYEQNIKETIEKDRSNKIPVRNGNPYTSPLNGNQMKVYTLAKSVLEYTEKAKVKKSENKINTSGISSEKQLDADTICKENEYDDLEEDNCPLRKVNCASHLIKCGLVTEEKERTTNNSKVSEFQRHMNISINGFEIPFPLSTSNMSAVVQEVTVSSEISPLVLNDVPPIIEVCGHKEIGIEGELEEKPLFVTSDVYASHSSVKNIQEIKHEELSNVTKHSFDDTSSPSVELSVTLRETSVKSTNQGISEVNISQHQILEHTKMENELLVNSKSIGLMLGEEKLTLNTGQVTDSQTVAEVTSPQNAACKGELNDKTRETLSPRPHLQAKHVLPLACDDNHADTQKGFQKSDKIRNFDKKCIWNLPRTDETSDSREVTYVPDPYKQIFEEKYSTVEVESFGDVLSKNRKSSGFKHKSQEQANVSKISTKIRSEANRGRLSGKVPKDKVMTLHSQGNQPVLANVDTSTARNPSPDTISKVRSEMGPPLPPLLPPLIATPPRNLHSFFPIVSKSSKLSVPSPLDDLIAPLCETPAPPLVSPLSDDPKYKSPVLETPSPSDILSRRILSSPLQFCSATPKHALPVPGRLPTSAGNSLMPGIPQENSVKILDTMYPELSARARTLNILKGNIQLNRCASLDSKSLSGPVNQITGFKAITSTSTAFMKTRGNSNNGISEDSPRDFEGVQSSNLLSHNGKRSLMATSMPKSAKRLRLDSESPCKEFIKKVAETDTFEECDSRLQNEASSIDCNGSIHHKSIDESGSELPSLMHENGDLNEVVNNALRTIGESCFDLFPVIRSHIFVGNISKVPVMRDEEKRVVYEFTVSKKVLAEPLLCGIINKLKTERMSLDHCYLQALCRVYVGVCRQLGDLERARLFCYNILKEGFPESEKLTLFIISVWHDIFSIRGVINKAMQSVMKQRAKGEVLTCLSSYLNWEKSPPLSTGIILSSLLMAIELCPNVKFQLSERFGEELSDTMWEYLFAIDLLCCHRKWVWTHDNVISKELWPIMDKWVKHRKGHTNIASTPHIIVAAVLRLIGRLSQIGLKEGFVSAVKNISSVISTFIQHAKEEDVPWGVQLASVYTLYDLAPSDPVGILKTLQVWRTETSNNVPAAVTNCINGIESLCPQHN